MLLRVRWLSNSLVLPHGLWISNLGINDHIWIVDKFVNKVAITGRSKSQTDFQSHALFFFSHTSTSINFYVNYNCGENKTEKQKMRVVKVSIKDVGCLDLYCRMFPDY